MRLHAQSPSDRREQLPGQVRLEACYGWLWLYPVLLLAIYRGH